MYRLVRLYLETKGREGIPVRMLGGQYRIARTALEELAGGPVHLPEVADCDAAVNLENFYVDDVSLTAADATVFSDDIEAPDPWMPGGTPGFAWVTAQPVT